MPYRADREAQRDRCEALEREVLDLRRSVSALAETARLLAAKERELTVARSLLSEWTSERRSPLLDSLRIASPCSASWEAMTGDDRVRFCKPCGKNVYNLSAMSREEAEALVHANAGGSLCARMYKREDGSVLTADCPVGVRKKRVRRMVALAAATGGLAAAATLPTVGQTTQGATVRVTEVSAHELRRAAEMWRSTHMGPCPTVEMLRDDGAIDPGSKLTDAWDRPFEIACDEDETTVRSAGRDGEQGTADDIRVPR
jgi:hypothetical protein